MKRMLPATPRVAIGIKVVLAMFAHGKPALAAPTPKTEHKQTFTLLHQRSIKPQSQPRAAEQFEVLKRTAGQVGSETARMWSLVVQAASADIYSGAPMSYEEVRLWLQSYNAGPYACLKYKGRVPYRETMNYVPRVLKYFQEDLSGSAYDRVIVETARKYGLDPQLIRAIVKAESDFNRRTVSHAGARGLMQVMPVVWAEVQKRYKLQWNYSRDAFDPGKNIEVACAYLAWLRYDFLPSHFAEFSPNPEAPAIVKRDRRKIRTKRISVRDSSQVTQLSSLRKSANGI